MKLKGETSYWRLKDKPEGFLFDSVQIENLVKWVNMGIPLDDIAKRLDTKSAIIQWVYNKEKLCRT